MTNKGELTDYTYEQEAELIEANREAYEAGEVHFIFDEVSERWRKVVTPQ